jgi:hypothetical protein
MTELFMTPEQGERLLSQKPQRRRRRSKAEMQQVRLSDSIKTPDPVSTADIATIVSTENTTTDLSNELGTITLHADQALSASTADETYREADAWMPESIGYLVGKVSSGKPLCMEDRHTLERIASSYGKGLLPFVYWHAKVTREFNALLRSLQTAPEPKTAEDFEGICFDLEEALASVKQYPFLCTHANIVLLDNALFRGRFNDRRTVIWRNQMARIHGYSFADIDA